MKNKIGIVLSVLIFFFSVTIVSSAPAQSATPQETLSQYVSDLQRNPGDDALREKIIKLAQTMDPKPAVPEEARTHLIRGGAAAKLAKTPEDFNDAISEFQEALKAAPWYSKAYFNLGFVSEKTGDYTGAIRAYKYYIMAEPTASDAQEMRDKIIELEYTKEKAQKAAEEAGKEKEAQRQYMEKIGFLAGQWNGKYIWHWSWMVSDWADKTSYNTFNITINGKEIEIYNTSNPETILEGRIAGNDSASIRWETASSASLPHEPVSVEVSPSRIHFTLPNFYKDRRINDFSEYTLTR